MVKSTSLESWPRSLATNPRIALKGKAKRGSSTDPRTQPLLTRGTGPEPTQEKPGPEPWLPTPIRESDLRDAKQATN